LHTAQLFASQKLPFRLQHSVAGDRVEVDNHIDDTIRARASRD
jgi:hypothetical protein